MNLIKYDWIPMQTTQVEIYSINSKENIYNTESNLKTIQVQGFQISPERNISKLKKQWEETQILNLAQRYQLTLEHCDRTCACFQYEL